MAELIETDSNSESPSLEESKVVDVDSDSESTGSDGLIFDGTSPEPTDGSGTDGDSDVSRSDRSPRRWKLYENVKGMCYTIPFNFDWQAVARADPHLQTQHASFSDPGFKALRTFMRYQAPRPPLNLVKRLRISRTDARGGRQSHIRWGDWFCMTFLEHIRLGIIDVTRYSLDWVDRNVVFKTVAQRDRWLAQGIPWPKPKFTPSRIHDSTTWFYPKRGSTNLYRPTQAHNHRRNHGSQQREQERRDSDRNSSLEAVLPPTGGPSGPPGDVSSPITSPKGTSDIEMDNEGVPVNQVSHEVETGIRLTGESSLRASEYGSNTGGTSLTDSLRFGKLRASSEPLVTRDRADTGETVATNPQLLIPPSQQSTKHPTASETPRTDLFPQLSDQIESEDNQSAPNMPPKKQYDFELVTPNQWGVEVPTNTPPPSQNRQYWKPDYTTLDNITKRHDEAKAQNGVYSMSSKSPPAPADWPVYSYILNTDQVTREQDDHTPPPFVLLDESAILAVTILVDRHDRFVRWPYTFGANGQVRLDREVFGKPPMIWLLSRDIDENGQLQTRGSDAHYVVHQRCVILKGADESEYRMAGSHNDFRNQTAKDKTELTWGQIQVPSKQRPREVASDPALHIFMDFDGRDRSVVPVMGRQIMLSGAFAAINKKIVQQKYPICVNDALYDSTTPIPSSETKPTTGKNKAESKAAGPNRKITHVGSSVSAEPDDNSQQPTLPSNLTTPTPSTKRPAPSTSIELDNKRMRLMDGIEFFKNYTSTEGSSLPPTEQESKNALKGWFYEAKKSTKQDHDKYNKELNELFLKLSTDMEDLKAQEEAYLRKQEEIIQRRNQFDQLKETRLLEQTAARFQKILTTMTPLTTPSQRESFATSVTLHLEDLMKNECTVDRADIPGLNDVTAKGKKKLGTGLDKPKSPGTVASSSMKKRASPMSDDEN